MTTEPTSVGRERKRRRVLWAGSIWVIGLLLAFMGNPIGIILAMFVGAYAGWLAAEG